MGQPSLTIMNGDGTTGTMNEEWIDLSVRFTQMFKKMFKVGVVDPGDARRTVGG